MIRPQKTLARAPVGLALARAIFGLTTLVGAHDLDHLRGHLDSRRCAVCKWSYGAHASMAITVSLGWALSCSGQCPSEMPVSPRAIPYQSRSSGAPPHHRLTPRITRDGALPQPRPSRPRHQGGRMSLGPMMSRLAMEKASGMCACQRGGKLAVRAASPRGLRSPNVGEWSTR